MLHTEVGSHHHRVHLKLYEETEKTETKTRRTVATSRR